MQQGSLLPTIGFIEFFERFGFYTMQGILVLFLMQTKHFSSTDAFHVYGAFFALVYGFVGFGGWCGDRILGPVVTIFLGLFLMFLGYLGLGMGPDTWFFPCLSAVCIGNAMFKANPANLLGKMYVGDTQRLHAAFTMFYMAVNLGALLALIVGPSLSLYFNYHYTFSAAAVGILIAMVFVGWRRSALQSLWQKKSRIKFRDVIWVLGVIATLWYLTIWMLSYYQYVRLGLKFVIGLSLLIYLGFMLQEPKKNQCRLLAVLILMLEAIVFFTLYNQMPTSINLYAILHVRAEVWGLHFDPQSFQALNPMWIIIWSPFLAKFYSKYSWSIFSKFSIGMLSCGVSYVVLYLSHFFVDVNLHLAPWWLVCSYIFQSLGELLVSALGLAMVAELVPVSWMGAVMGMWFLTSAVSGFTGAALASMVGIPRNIQASPESLQQFAHLFGEIAVVVLILGGMMCLSVRAMEKLVE